MSLFCMFPLRKMLPLFHFLLQSPDLPKRRTNYCNHVQLWSLRVEAIASRLEAIAIHPLCITFPFSLVSYPTFCKLHAAARDIEAHSRC